MKYQSDNTSHVLSAIDSARQSFFTLEKSGVNNYFKNNKGVPHLYSTLSDDHKKQFDVWMWGEEFMESDSKGSLQTYEETN